MFKIIFFVIKAIFRFFFPKKKTELEIQQELQAQEIFKTKIKKKIIKTFAFLILACVSLFLAASVPIIIFEFFRDSKTIRYSNIQATTKKFTSVAQYFRYCNENVGALDKNIVIYERNVPQKIKKLVFEKENGKCVICGSTQNLAVDHCRALENGGSNDISNLHLLCPTCHDKKTKMDNSLRRKRKNSN